MKNVLFLCTGNSARSIMAEAYMNHAAAKQWRAWSAGSKPVGKPNPLALETLTAHEISFPSDANAPRSKSWDEFSATGAPELDLVVTVCDNAAAETCPVWPARFSAEPAKLHWSFPDPAAVEGHEDAKREAFTQVFADIRQRIDAFITKQD